MLRNLLAEMARKDIKQIDMATALGVNEKTLRNKLNEVTAFTFPETQLIRNTYFPELKLEYLFAQDKDASAEPEEKEAV